MEKNNLNISINSYYFNLLFTVLFTVLGYFVYNGIRGALGIFLLCLLYDIFVLLSIIPFGGCIGQAILMVIISPRILDLVSLYPTWLTATIFWIYLIYGIFITLVSSIIYLTILSK